MYGHLWFEGAKFRRPLFACKAHGLLYKVDKFREGSGAGRPSLGQIPSLLQDAAGDDKRLVRVMPNTPCLVGETAAAMCLGGKADDSDAELVGKLFDAVGKIYRQAGVQREDGSNWTSSSSGAPMNGGLQVTCWTSYYQSPLPFINPQAAWLPRIHLGAIFPYELPHSSSCMLLQQLS